MIGWSGSMAMCQKRPAATTITSAGHGDLHLWRWGVVGSMGIGFRASLRGLPPEGPYRDPHCHCAYPIMG